MNRLILAVALAAGCTLASSAPALGAAARNYDCSKPGNANKAACKGAAKAATAAAAKATPASKPAPKASSTSVASTTTTKTVTTKNYDCSKAGNKNKAVCKTAETTPAKPVAKQTTVATTTRHYDCTKAGNANKQECKVSTASTQTATKPAAEAKPAAAPRRTAAAPAPASVEDKNPAGAIAQCKDGTYSHAKQRAGACSRHGGVAKWS